MFFFPVIFVFIQESRKKLKSKVCNKKTKLVYLELEFFTEGASKRVLGEIER